MLKDYSEFWISSIVAMEHAATLFYSWSIRYIVNRAPVTIACIRICPIWSQLYNAPEGKKGLSKDNGFLYKKNEKGEWRLVLPSTFKMKGQKYPEDAIKEAYEATAHGGVEKMLQWLTDKFICQPFSRLVKEYVASCDTCQPTKYSNKPPLEQVTMLHVPARTCTDITMDFL